MSTIRPYTPSDWERICDIHDSARIDELNGSVDLAAFIPLKDCFEEEELFDDAVWVYETNKLVIGFIAFNPNEINWLYIDTNFYRQGVGKQLISFAISQSDADEIHIVCLSNNTPAIRLYEKMGFVEYKRKKGKLSGNSAFDAEGIFLKWTREKTE